MRPHRVRQRSTRPRRPRLDCVTSLRTRTAPSTPVKARMTVRARAAARPATTAAKPRIAARVRAAVPPTAPSHPSWSSLKRDRLLRIESQLKAHLRPPIPFQTRFVPNQSSLVPNPRPETHMSGNRFNAFQNHGVGIGLRIPHYQHIFSRKPVVDWFEIISENFMIDAGRPLAMLDQILEQYRVVQHGVSMYFGSVTAPDPEHLRRLKGLVRRTGTPWLSDHLCWGS